VFIVMVYLGIDTYFFGAIYAVGGQIELLNTSLNNNENVLAQCKYNKLVLNYIITDQIIGRYLQNCRIAVRITGELGGTLYKMFKILLLRNKYMSSI